MDDNRIYKIEIHLVEYYYDKINHSDKGPQRVGQVDSIYSKSILNREEANTLVFMCGKLLKE